MLYSLVLYSHVVVRFNLILISYRVFADDDELYSKLLIQPGSKCKSNATWDSIFENGILHSVRSSFQNACDLDT